MMNIPASCRKRFTVFALPAVMLSFLIGCSTGSDNPAPAAAPSSSVTATIGTAGGTVTGPDGVQVVIPAGALTGNTTIGIARNPAGAPNPLQQGNAPGGPIYEFTPHDIIFNTPVTIRMPIPSGAVNNEVFMASLGGSWVVVGATPNGTFAEIPRNSFSFGMTGLPCVAPANDPHPCAYPSGGASIDTSTTASLTQIAPGFLGLGSGSAGSWRVDQPGTVAVKFSYSATADCSDPRLTLRRWNLNLPLNDPNRTQVLLNNVSIPGTVVTATLGVGFIGGGGTHQRLEGSLTVDVSANLQDAVNPFGFSFSCQRPAQFVSGRSGGGDVITILGPMAPPNGPFTIGGTVGGLNNGASVVLQNNGGNDQTVTPPSTSFAFPAIPSGSTYAVTVRTQPTGQTCSVTNGTGTASSNVTSVSVTCVSTATGGLAFAANSTGNTNANTLSIFRRDASTGALTSLGTVGTGLFPFRVAVTPNGRFAYVTNLVGGTVSSFSIDNATGVLSLIPLSSPSTINPFGIAMDRLGRFLWVANYSANTVSAFSINQTTGVLAAAGGPIGAGGSPYAVVAHPTADFIYVANEFGNSVSVYSVDPGTGALTLVTGTLANSYLRPHALAIDPTGTFLYAASASERDVAAFRINATTGRLTAAGFFSGTNANWSPESLAVHPNGRFLYVSNKTSPGDLWTFSINATTGALTQVGQPIASGGNLPADLSLNAAGTFLYVTNTSSNNVSVFGVDSATGVLSALGTGAATGSNPEGVALTP